MRSIYFKINPLKTIIGLFILAELFSFSAKANPGDTTWVTVYNQRKLTYYGNYDTTSTFPTGKRYRKIRLHYILGRYACPASAQYCGSWDYTTQIFARPADNDSVEIARVITPYATDWLNLNKKHDYIVEVTDYATALEGITAMRFNYSGYSWGFTITLKIEFIEGVPPMDELDVKNIYSGYFPYGNSTNSIENYLTAKTFTYGSNVSKVFLKNSISGHGSDNTGCAEFCSKIYDLKINNSYVAQHQLWRNNCGINQVYPQTGTWIYNRGNWCPGAIVWPIYHDLTAITSANTSFTVDVDMQPYVGSGTLGGYGFQTQIITYGNANHTRDVSIEDVMAPTKDDNYFRQNPRCSSPLISIKNTGTANVTSIAFDYGVVGSGTASYTWTGQMAFLDTLTMAFPASSAMLSSSVSAIFTVAITAVNGQASDDNTFNNIYTSTFTPVQIMPNSIVVKVLTNNSAAQNMWTLYDDNNFPIVSSSPYSNTTLYRDTITNLPPGCYRITLEDYGCDGLAWWANTAQGTGSMRIERTNGNNLFVFPTDFGCEFTKYFVVLPDPPPPVDTTPVPVYDADANTIEVFPNPASSSAYIKLDLGRTQKVDYVITDLNGRVLYSKSLEQVSGAYEKVNLQQFADGLYFVKITLEDNSTVTRKLLIQK